MSIWFLKAMKFHHICNKWIFNNLLYERGEVAQVGLYTCKHTQTHFDDPDFSLPIHSVVTDLCAGGKRKYVLSSGGPSFYEPYRECFVTSVLKGFLFVFVCLTRPIYSHFILSWRNRSVITMKETMALLNLLEMWSPTWYCPQEFPRVFLIICDCISSVLDA